MRKITKGKRNTSPVTDSNEKTKDNINNTAEDAVFPGTETPEETSAPTGGAVSDDTVTAGIPTIGVNDDTTGEEENIKNENNEEKINEEENVKLERKEEKINKKIKK